MRIWHSIAMSLSGRHLALHGLVNGVHLGNYKIATEHAMETTVNWEELGIEANRDRRREARIPLSIAIEVTGFDAQGKFFSDATKTVDVSERGCSFRLKRRVDRGGIVAIKVTVKDGKQRFEQRPLLYQVARATEDGNGWIIGAAKLQPESVWYVAFPKTGAEAEAHQ